MLKMVQAMTRLKRQYMYISKMAIPTQKESAYDRGGSFTSLKRYGFTSITK